jgi:hypothetical protein
MKVATGEAEPDAEAAVGDQADAAAPGTETTEKPAKTEDKKKPEDLTQDKLSRGFAKLKDQEERLARRYETWQGEVKAKEAELAKFKEERAAFETKREVYYKNPEQLLADHGWDVDKFVQYVMSDGKVPPDVLARQLQDQHKADLEKTRKEIEELKSVRQREEDAQLASEYDRQVATRVESIIGKDDAFLPEAAESYPMFLRVIEEFGRDEVLEDVKRALIKHHQDTGQVVDPLRAVMYLDRAYRQRFPKMASKLGGNPAQNGAGASANSGAEKPRQLTTSDRSDIGTPSEEELDQMTPEERRARATRIFQGS